MHPDSGASPRLEREVLFPACPSGGASHFVAKIAVARRDGMPLSLQCPSLILTPKVRGPTEEGVLMTSGAQLRKVDGDRLEFVIGLRGFAQGQIPTSLFVHIARTHAAIDTLVTDR